MPSHMSLRAPAVLLPVVFLLTGVGVPNDSPFKGALLLLFWIGGALTANILAQRLHRSRTKWTLAAFLFPLLPAILALSPARSAPTPVTLGHASAEALEVPASPASQAQGTSGSSGEDFWAQAIEAANSNRASEAQRLFGLAIKDDPWRFCGIGRGSWKPAKPHQQLLWLQAMRDVGLQDVAAAILNPPPPAELTIMSMMAADDKLENILNAACTRSGWSRAAG